MIKYKYRDDKGRTPILDRDIEEVYRERWTDDERPLRIAGLGSREVREVLDAR